MQLPDFLIKPRQLIEDQDITPLDGDIYGVIYWFTKLKLEKCILTNKQIAELLHCTEGGVENSLVRLVKGKYVQSFYDRPKHQRELVPTIVFGVHSTPSNNGVAATQIMGSIYKEDNKNKNDRSKDLSGASPRNEQIDKILKDFETHIGHIPSDRKPRMVAQNIRQLTDTFVKINKDTFHVLRTQDLTFDYALDKMWRWYKAKDYCTSTEKLETVKLKMKVYYDDVTKKLLVERREKYGQENGSNGHRQIAEPINSTGANGDSQGLSVLSEPPVHGAAEMVAGME